MIKVAVIEETVASIGIDAFNNCSNLTSVSIGNRVWTGEA